MKQSILVSAWSLCAVLATMDANATTLLFEPDVGSYGDFVALPSGYGDRVTAAVQGGFKYDLVGGATPNVITQYGAAHSLVDLFTWNGNFGDLNHVVIAREPYPFEMRLVADAGFNVKLNSFDMAGWPNLDFASIASVSVSDGSGNILFSQSNPKIEGDGTGPQHTSFSFAGGLSATELRIRFDSTTDGHGTFVDSDDIGIDNINFSQAVASVPEPETYAMLLAGLGLLGCAARRRKQ